MTESATLARSSRPSIFVLVISLRFLIGSSCKDLLHHLTRQDNLFIKILQQLQSPVTATRASVGLVLRTILLRESGIFQVVSQFFRIHVDHRYLKA
jgi:hypothetical protein